MEKNTIVLILCVAICFATFAQSESAFVIDESGTITRFSGQQGGSVVIPAQIDGIQVTAIQASAFVNNQLRAVTIPDSVSSIGRSAFANNSLETINIPDSITSIAEDTFINNQLSYIVIPASVATIGSAAFRNNRLLSVTLPDGVTTIERSAFAVNRLCSVTIPDSVTSIGDMAFWDNPLTSITIGFDVTLSQGRYPSFSFRFDRFYNENGRMAGTYTLNNGQWGMR